MYDMQREITVKGIVTGLEWSNPHVLIYVDVSDDKLKAIVGKGAVLTLNARQMTPRDLKGAIANFAKERGLARRLEPQQREFSCLACAQHDD